MRKVFITRRVPDIARDTLAEHFEVHANDRNEALPAERLPELVEEYDAILSTVADKFNAGVLSRKGRLQVLSNYAVGLDNIDLEAARAQGITVYNTPEAVTESTADMAFALLLALTRQIEPAREFVRQGKWTGWNPQLFLGEELQGKTLGILGFGRTGKAVARRALGFGLHVIYHRPAKTPPEAALDAYATPVAFDELMERSDYLSLHVPLTAETRGMINAAVFAKMRRRPMVLNMARGDVVVTDDLVKALETGQIRAAGLDVVTADRLSHDHPLCKMENVVVVPHIGTATVECRRKMAHQAARNIVNHFIK
jgi:glyoxylate reductase